MREEPDPILWKTAPGFDSWSTDEFEVHLSQGRVIKERPKKRLLEVDSEGKTYLVKVYRGDGGFRRLPSGAKAEHEFHMSLRLVEAGIPTVPLIALGDRPEEGLVVMEKLEGWTDLQKILLDPDRLPAEIRDRIRCYGRFARRLHDAGIWQQDFNPTNILASTTAGEHELKLIDFERMKWKRSLSTGERYRSLAKMNRIPRLSRTDRMRFLRAYLGGEEGRCQEAAREILVLFRNKVSEDGRKMARLCSREGKRFGEFYTETGKIYFRKGDRTSTPQGLSSGNVEDLFEREWAGFKRIREREALQTWKETHRNWTGTGDLPVAVEVDSSTGEGWVIYPE